MTVVARIQGLEKNFGAEPVLRGLDLDVPRGACVAVLGPNGAGKTTTLRVLLGQSPYTRGTVEVFGLAMPDHARRVRARIGVVPQADNLDPDFTVAENLLVYGRYFGLGDAALRTRVPELLAFADLSTRAAARIGTLSGGMKRRLIIARALINDPELIILDEPTTALDPQARHLVWSRLHRLREQGKTLILTTHYMEEAERLADRIVIVDHGRVLDHGIRGELIRRHVEPEVIEVRGRSAEARALLAPLDGTRLETVGETLYAYTRAARPLLDRLEARPDLTYLHRPANLEDVFLQLTGRELRD